MEHGLALESDRAAMYKSETRQRDPHNDPKLKGSAQNALPVVGGWGALTANYVEQCPVRAKDVKNAHAQAKVQFCCVVQGVSLDHLSCPGEEWAKGTLWRAWRSLVLRMQAFQDAGAYQSTSSTAQG